MLKAVPSHTHVPLTTRSTTSARQTCHGVTVNGSPCRQVVVQGFYNTEGQIFCHNHQSQARLGNMFLKERWDNGPPRKSNSAPVTGKLKHNNQAACEKSDNGSMRQLIAQFQRLFHTSSKAKSYSNAEVIRSVPVAQKQLQTQQVHRPVLQPLQPRIQPGVPPRVVSAPSKLPIQIKPPVPKQCEAINRNNGRQCSRTFKDETETFCFQHRKMSADELTQTREQVILPNILVKDFARYIPDHLSSHTKKLLYQELCKPLSQSDSPGYIYTYMLTSSSTATHALFKIGRTNNLHRRMYQWVSKCEYVPQLVECFPRTEDEEQVRFSHRVERLIHIELSDRYRADAEICGGCGGTHREWFKVARQRGMSDRDMWLILREVVVRWVNYVSKVTAR
ncbi:hypothetical protein NQZ79_g7080 [Umbelopsis isabellina]|nr:hypothetical protein NQZ79_g7080 [Umbelopsis isabellina]